MNRVTKLLTVGRSGPVVVLLWLAGVCSCLAAPPPSVDFNREIRPLLADRCFSCHGPDARQRQADLRLDEESGASSVLVAHDPDASELVRRISSQGEDRMPPLDSTRPLQPEEIELIRRWIETGAQWSQHWSLLPVRAEQLPDLRPAATEAGASKSAAPSARQRQSSPVPPESWARNSIDYFVLAQLNRQGQSPSPPASRERLIRRLSFDLTGLPPTLQEIDSFLTDPSPRAYQRVVDRLLASPHFGERMAADWLDVARYSDTYGYQVDRDRFVWPWRDWVIRAFNRNLPYDQFVTQQLAGDLLPDGTSEEILATAFNRLHPQKVEGGSVPEEFRSEYVADRTETLGTAFLGLALACARCHDHKYDPVTQQEYYQLSAFMDNIDEAGLYSYFTPAVPTPTLLLTDQETRARLREQRLRVERAEQRLIELASQQHADFLSWLGERGQRSAAVKAESSDAAALTAGRAGVHQLVHGRVAWLDFEQTDHRPNRRVAGQLGNAVELTGDDGIQLDVGNFQRCQPFSVTLWLNVPRKYQRAVVFHRSRAWTDAGSRGYQLLIEDGRLSASLIHFWPGNAIRIRTRERLLTKSWQHLAVTYDGSSQAAGLQIYLNGKLADCVVIRDNLYKHITGGGGDNITIGQRFRDRGLTQGKVDEFQVFDRRITPLEVAQLYDGTTLETALKSPASSLTADQRQGLRQYYLATVDHEYVRQLSVLRKVREAAFKTLDGAPEIMVMRELALPRPTYVLRRGAYNERQRQVEAGTPAALPPFPAAAARNRLGLAQWLTSGEHPLTSRVAANRIWQLLFGWGIVRTPEDFGIQGQRPTHPELLDWLAQQLLSHDWDIKHLIRQIVTSATYRQSSQVTAKLLETDPENRLLGRGPSYRLPAEMLRDNALAVSGLLAHRLGGPPAKPYEVEVSFKPVKRDTGDGLYRRSLYTYWKRTGPAPVMMALDASKRDVCRVRRERTASPLQAFVLLNGPQFVEAARALAQRLLRERPPVDHLLTDLFRTLTSRRPAVEELQVLRELYQQQLAYFRDVPGRARQYLQIGEQAPDHRLDPIQLAAASVVANMLMNHDESVTKR